MGNENNPEINYRRTRERCYQIGFAVAINNA